MTTLPPIIGITGYAGVGKDTVADILVSKLNYEKRSLADPIREILTEMNPVIGRTSGRYLKQALAEFGWEGAKRRLPEVRHLMKKLGHGVRTHVNQGVWIAKALENRPELLVIADVRFLNEALAIEALGGSILRVTRPGVAAESSFESEVDKIEADYEVRNDGTLEDLELAVEHALFPAVTSRKSVNDEFNDIVREWNEAQARIAARIAKIEAALGEPLPEIQVIADSTCPPDTMFLLNRAYMRQQPIFPKHGITDPVFKADL